MHYDISNISIIRVIITYIAGVRGPVITLETSFLPNAMNIAVML